MPSESLPSLAKDADRRAPRSPAWRDLACVIAVTLVAGALFARFDFSEYAFRLTRSAERFQLDELPPTLVVLAIGFAWFAWRRYREAQSEVRRRRVLEEEAEHLLAENRRLASQARTARRARPIPQRDVARCRAHPRSVGGTRGGGSSAVAVADAKRGACVSRDRRDDPQAASHRAR
jgi:hypothetical protein